MPYPHSWTHIAREQDGPKEVDIVEAGPKRPSKGLVIIEHTVYKTGKLKKKFISRDRMGK